MIYSNTTWKLYNSTTGAINVTDTKEACQAAARPDVDPAYKNYCVQCLPSYFPGIKKTYYIPVKPVKANNAKKLKSINLLVFIIFEI